MGFIPLFFTAVASATTAAVPSAVYTNIGCWKDTAIRAITTLEGEDSRLDGNYQRRQDAIRKCYEVAKDRGFRYFALQHGGWCAASWNGKQRYKMYGKSDACRDGKGGGWANDVYVISEPGAYKYMGCWRDTSRRAITTLEGTDPLLDGKYTTRKNAIQKCYQAAKKRGFKYFAVQHGGWCAASGNARARYRMYGKSNACRMGKGGGWANDVYAIYGTAHVALTSAVTPAISFLEQYHSFNHVYTNIGCWKDTAIRAITTLEGEDSRLDGNYQGRHDAIRKCYEAAKHRGLRYFALQHGGWCAASWNGGQRYKMYGKSGACRNGKGGGWANDVYVISEPGTYENMGCWRDTRRRAITTLEGTDPVLDGKYTTRKNAIQKCYQAAKKRGFKYFAVQHGGWCAASGNAGARYRMYGRSNACRMGKGGGWANDVYAIYGNWIYWGYEEITLGYA